MEFYLPRCLAGDCGASDGFSDVSSRRARGSGLPNRGGLYPPPPALLGTLFVVKIRSPRRA